MYFAPDYSTLDYLRPEVAYCQKKYYAIEIRLNTVQHIEFNIKFSF